MCYTQLSFITEFHHLININRLTFFFQEGKDGYDCLKGLPIIMDAESCTNLPTMVQNSFSLAAMASGLRKPRNTSVR